MSKKSNKGIFIGLSVLAIVGYFATANGAIVLNGSDSLPHNAYYMLKAPLIMKNGVYVAFERPEILEGKFDEVAFVKRVVGTPGDLIVVNDNEVCVGTTCRTLHEDMIAAGYLPLEGGVIPEQEYVVFGDSADSLDSRYRAIGTVRREKIIAAGVPFLLPNWKEIRTWLHG